jgi:hypothetical protein
MVATTKRIASIAKTNTRSRGRIVGLNEAAGAADATRELAQTSSLADSLAKQGMTTEEITHTAGRFAIYL